MTCRYSTPVETPGFAPALTPVLFDLTDHGNVHTTLIIPPLL